ncbi:MULTISPECIES: hypothetical protein [unclassified Tolypothrix]|uniref:hypothetical protein n=1 Tax=unclassified Tolypothrix TaxID=2649714 RepID=UPI0005EAA740|nr:MULTISPECIES: hypothetical protein [unclassified Tolypothrix]BAY96051.1 hypothetical protein NIES3275_81280 [Microchaete diplosiphon NIES-3275]EKE98240.1 hypothetical protein FDUTEX481_04258 [Tolypothrix sp. PCC 7601]MBE9085513.1 hypothetical protein [Tolypothrix sp. LEGE 11397]UYD31111.1 hypothetical protein HGR01_40250 [Tolypothrix sp. PCC 7712]UYD38915.1 hypothetical protein HG267_41095 [Tolypothrix sp. PCC 7601]
MNKPFENKQPEFESYQSNDDSFSDDEEQQLKDWEPQEKPFDFSPPGKSTSAIFWKKTVEIVSRPKVRRIGAAVVILSATALLISEVANAEST